MANIKSDASLWETFQKVIKDGNLTDADIRSLRVETGASDAIFRDLINDGLEEVSGDLSKYITSEDFDFENGQISVQDANGNELWDGTNGIKIQEYRDLLGYDDDQMGQDRIEEWKDATWESFVNDMPNLQGGETRQEKELTIFGKKYIFNPNSTTKDDFFAQVLDPYLTDETDGRRILEVIKRNENPGTWKFNEDDNGNYTWDYFNPEQGFDDPPEVEDPDSDLYTGGDWDEPNLEPWQMEYQNIEKLGRFYDMNFYEEDLAFDGEKAWSDLTDEEKEGLDKNEYKQAYKRNVKNPAETWAQEQARQKGEVDDLTLKYENLKKNESYSFDDVNTVLSLFQPELYEVPTYGFKADIRKRQDVLDEMAKFNPDPYSGLTSELPEYEQPDYEYTPPDQEEGDPIVLDPLDPGDPYDPGDPWVPDDPDDPDDPLDPDDPGDPEDPGDPDDPGDDSWIPQWDERLFTGGKNQTTASRQQTFIGTNADGSKEGYTYDYTATKGGDFNYTIRNTSGKLVQWEDLDEISRRNIENEFNFDKK